MNNYLDVVGIQLKKERRILSNKEISSPTDAINVIANELKWLDREMLLSINLDNLNRVINAHVVAVGRGNYAAVDPKSIIKAALLSNAENIMLIHNHPSGCSRASKDDLKLTHQIDETCKILELSLLDHIVVGRDDYYSIKGNNTFKYEKSENCCINEEEDDLEIE